MDITSLCKLLYYIIQNITDITKYPMDDWLTTLTFFYHQRQPTITSLELLPWIISNFKIFKL